MSTDLSQDLRAEVARGQVLFVVGAGVSIAATKGNAPSWKRALESAAERCADVTAVPPGWLERQKQRIASPELSDLLEAANEAERVLKSKGGEFGRWLDDMFGRLEIQQRAELDALAALPGTLATTNYDGLLEAATGRRGCTWMEVADAVACARGDSATVLHLHGVWHQPDSVILSDDDYRRILSAPAAQSLQQALTVLRTVVYVGFGAGLDDPNFDTLRRWAQDTFGSARHRHFRLARAGDVADLRAKHEHEPIFVIAYGERLDQLAPFLRSLAPSSNDVVDVPESIAPLIGVPPRCFGRKKELDALVEAMLASPARPVSVLGPAGIGKTTVVRAAIHDRRVADRYGDRRWFVRGDSTTSAAALIADIGQAVGTAFPRTQERVLATLAGAPSLLVLDNLETAWEGDDTGTEAILAALTTVPTLVLVATLRGAARPQGVAWGAPIDVKPLLPDAARDLFLDIAGRAYASDRHLQPLLRALDGVPLGIELLAYATEGEPNLDGIARLWDQQKTRLLRRRGGTNPADNIEVSFNLSIKSPRMTENGLRLLRVLGVLPSGLARPDLDRLYPRWGFEAAGVLRKVGLAFDEGDRLRVLAPLREFVSRELEPRSKDLDPLIDHFVALVEAHGPKVGEGDGGEMAAAALSLDIGNLESILSIALRRKKPTSAVVAVIQLDRYFTYAGSPRLQLLARALAASRRLRQPLFEATCLQGLARAEIKTGDVVGAAQSFEAARRLYRRLGHAQGEADCLKGLVDVAILKTDFKAARALCETLLSTYRGIDEVLGEANCLRRLGMIARIGHDPEAARDYIRQAIAAYQRASHDNNLVACTLELAEIEELDGHDAEAEHLFQTGLEGARALGALSWTAMALLGLGSLNLRLWRENERADGNTKADQMLNQALALYRSTGEPSNEGNCLLELAILSSESGDLDRARALVAQARELYERADHRLGIGNCYHHLSTLESKSGHRAEARRMALQALSKFEAIGHAHSIDLVRATLAALEAESAPSLSHEGSDAAEDP